MFLPANETALFLDSSIQIARFVHSPKTKQAIERRLQQHQKTTTGLVVRQEFKRRLLKEADYLLRLIHQYKSFDEVHHHVIRLFGPWHQRKRNICLETMAQVQGMTDAERTERLRLYLRSLLVAGLRRFDQKVDAVRKDSRCACGLREVMERVPLRKYDFATDRCSKTTSGSCGVGTFFQKRKELCQVILVKLKALPEENKSKELQTAQKFLERLTNPNHQVEKEDPCLTVGDLFIALESAGISHFYTLNGTESQHLCRALDQSLIVRPIDPTKPDVVCSFPDSQWPDFGPRGTS